MKPLILVMGVSGTGKSTIGKMLAEKIEVPFYDADDFHPKANVVKMQSGKPLNDEDRAPWLSLLANKLEEWQKTEGAVLACSALKEIYRSTLSKEGSLPLQWIFLDGDFETIHRRMKERQGHFMPKELLQSQFDTLETPSNAITINITNSPKEIVEIALDNLKIS